MIKRSIRIQICELLIVLLAIPVYGQSIGEQYRTHKQNSGVKSSAYSNSNNNSIKYYLCSAPETYFMFENNIIYGVFDGEKKQIFRIIGNRVENTEAYFVDSKLMNGDGTELVTIEGDLLTAGVLYYKITDSALTIADEPIVCYEKLPDKRSLMLVGLVVTSILIDAYNDD